MKQKKKMVRGRMVNEKSNDTRGIFGKMTEKSERGVATDNVGDRIGMDCDLDIVEMNVG